MKRRHILLLFLSLPNLSLSQGISSIAELAALVKLIGELGDSISKLTKGFKDLIVAGHESYVYVSESMEKSRLLELSALLTKLHAEKNATVLKNIFDYSKLIEKINDGSQLQSYESIEFMWRQLLISVESTVVMVREILNHVQSDRSDFVLQSVYLSLNRMLYMRKRILSAWLEIPPPQSTGEIQILRDAYEKYKILDENCADLIGEINLYLLRKYRH